MRRGEGRRAGRRSRAASVAALGAGLALLAPGSAGAQATEEVPACAADQSSILLIKVVRSGVRRSVKVGFTENYRGAPVKPVQVLIRRRRTVQRQWRNLGTDHYAFRRRKGERVRVQVRYVEDRSNYGAGGGGGGPGPGIPGIPNLPIPAIPNLQAIPGLGALPTIDLPLLPDTGVTGGVSYNRDFCVRNLTKTFK